MSALENLKNFIDQMEHPGHCCPEDEDPSRVICFCGLLELQELSAKAAEEKLEITDEMETAGWDVMRYYDPDYDSTIETVRSIFREMLAVMPTTPPEPRVGRPPQS